MPMITRTCIVIYFNILQINMNISKYKNFIKLVQYALVMIGYALFINDKNNDDKTTQVHQMFVGIFDKFTMIILMIIFKYLNHQMKVKEI